jgi:hypothetical protein
MPHVEADRQAQSAAAGEGRWAHPVSARLGEVLVALALLATAAFFIWQSVRLPFGRVGLPGPGFFPFALGVVLGLLALVVLFHAVRLADTREPVFLGHRDVVIAVGGLCVLALAFEYVGAYVSLGAYTAVLLIFVAHAALWRVALGVALGMVAVWALFVEALGVRLPVGEVWGQLADWLAASPSF